MAIRAYKARLWAHISVIYHAYMLMTLGQGSGVTFGRAGFITSSARIVVAVRSHIVVVAVVI